MQKTSKRVLAVVLALVMMLSAFSVSISAAIDNYNPNYESTTHSVFKHTEQTLAPGVTQYTNYAYTKADGKQMVYYVTTADVTRDDVLLQVSYKGMQHDTYGMEKLTQTVATANAKYSNPDDEDFINEYYSVVSATNGNGYNMTTGQPSGVWAMGGDIIQEYTGSTAFFAILKDGRAVMGKTVAEWNAYKANPGIEEAINAFGSILVWDGAAAVSATGSYYSDRASRTMLGITEDGKVLLIVVDGRQEPFSCGASMAELAQIMMEAGAKYAINLDGGGSTTYMAKNEGTNDCVIVNRPSDGSERAISNGLIVASLAAPSNVFDHVSMSPADEYVTPGTSTSISVVGVSPAGTSAEVPDSITYATTSGTFEDGIFTAGNTAGDTVITAYYEGNAVGSTTVHVVEPDAVAFAGVSLSAPYGETIPVSFSLMYGVHEVAYKAADVVITLSDASLGSVNADELTFTATGETLANGKGTITVSLKSNPQIKASVPLEVGKGSEVLFDFENNSVDGWGWFDYYNADVNTIIDVATAETGKVHSGKYSMAYTMDFTQLTYYEDYIVSMMSYNADAIEARGEVSMEDFVDITGATGLGFWVYIPDEVDVAGIDPRFTFGYKQTETSAWTRGTTPMEFLIKQPGMGTDGWYYYYADLTQFSGYYKLTMQNANLAATSSKNGNVNKPYYGGVVEWYISDGAWKGSGIKSYNSYFTFYIDDITVDYSSVVADRELPVFGAATYATVAMSDAQTLTDGQVIGYDAVDFAVSVTDNMTKTNYTGLNANTAKVYVDGNEVAATYQNNRISVDKSVVLANGTHTVTFEIADNQGNYGHLTKSFVIKADTDYSTITVRPQNPNQKEVLVGSLYYVDAMASDIETVQSATVKLKVNNVNDWEPEGIVAAEGFTAVCTKDPADKGIVTVTVTRTGSNTQSGEAALFSIPVRAWYPHNVLGKDSNWIIVTKKCVYPMDIQVMVKAGTIEYVDSYSAANDGFFGSEKIQIDSEAMCEVGYIGVNKGNEGGTVNVTSWHSHNATAVADADATCTEDGYEGRTFCDECNSVVDWGTVVPATDHQYDFVDGVLQCTVDGTLFNGEYTDGKMYADGIALNGFVDGKYYIDGIAADYTGIVNIDGVYYEFDNGTLIGEYTGLYYDEADGVYRYIQLGEISTGWKQIDGDWYYFRSSTKAAATGHYHYDGPIYYDFEETGRLIDGAWAQYDEGWRYYYGPACYRASGVSNVMFVEIDGVLYGFDKDGYRYEGLHYVFESNQRVPLMYDFDIENGPTVFTGIHEDCCYIEGVLQTSYQLIELNGDYYFINDGNKIAKSTKLYLSDRFVEGKTFADGSPIPAGYYDFDADGKMIIVSTPDVPSVKNGPVGDYMYENGEIVQRYQLYNYNGDWYFINDGNKIAKSTKLYLGEKYVAGKTFADGTPIPADTYEFDADGKMMVLNGPVGDYMYKNGVVVPRYQLYNYNGDWYFINDGNKIAKNTKLYLSEKYVEGKTFADGTPIPADTYSFDADGKMMILNGPVGDYMYKNGVVVQRYQLYSYNGDWYFINDGNKIAKSTKLYLSEKFVEGKTFADGTPIPADYYEFDADGKMMILNGPVGDYMYKNGVIVPRYQLYNYNGDWYFINDGNKIAKSTKLYLSEKYVQGTDFLPGLYEFKADGKMIY